MAKELEIIVSNDDSEEKRILGIRHSLYKAAYFETVKIFLKNSRQIDDNRKRNRWNEDPNLDDYQENPDNMDNVIAIVGGRGSGKTTAMQEIRTIFENFNRYKMEWIKKIGEPYASELKGQIETDFAFSLMEVVDASVLEEKDDLLEIILWHMYREVNDKLYKNVYNGRCSYDDQDGRKFADALDEVYRMHQRVKGKYEEKSYGESAVTALENMPNSIRTRQAMRNLMEIYCKILFPHQFQNAYLVVAIDDLDLNIHKGYQMLEEIRRYLLDWKIIVLLAVDYKQMEMVCETHFYREFGVKRYHGVDENLIRHIGELSNSYMTKIFPFSNRIYLAEQNLKNALIDCGNQSYSVKKYLLCEIARKMHIFYDACGVKTHFCEPNNVRELVSYVRFLDSLNTVEWGTEEREAEGNYRQRQLKYYDQNHEKFNQDIIERMAFQILKSKQRYTFDDLLRRDLKRRTGYVLQCYENFKNEKEPLKEVAEKGSYTFGEFLGCIYEWGRKDYEYKPLMHCLLASFTSEMTREYINYCYNKDNPDSRKRSKERLEGYLGVGIAGGWLGEGLGKVTVRSQDMPNGAKNEEKDMYVELIAYKKDRDLQQIRISFHLEIMYEDRPEEKYAQILEECAEKKVIPILECIFMCINNYRHAYGGSLCKPQIRIRKAASPLVLREPYSEFDFQVKILNAKCADFDVLGFIKQSVDYESWKKETGEEIYNQIEEFAMKVTGYHKMVNRGRRVEKALQDLRSSSMFAGEKSESIMALPLYNLDLSYNILKRVRNRCIKEFAVACNSGDELDRIDRIYRYIEEELEKNAKEYNEGREEKYPEFSYLKIFVNDPYIKKFRELVKDRDTKILFSKILKEVCMLPKWVEPVGRIGESLENE